MRIYFDEEDLDGQFRRTLTHAYERGTDLGEAFATPSCALPSTTGRQCSTCAATSAIPS